MSKQNDKFSSTFYNKDHKRTRTPPRADTNPPRRGQKSYDVKKKISENQIFQEVAMHEKD